MRILFIVFCFLFFADVAYGDKYKLIRQHLLEAAERGDQSVQYAVGRAHLYGDYGFK